MRNTQFTLRKYAGMAAVFLTIPEISEAEAVYTNIDPDTIINDDLELVRIDMDDNGTFDFAFLKFTGTVYTYWSHDYSYFYYLLVAPQISGNAIAGIKSVIDPSYGGFTLYFPYALAPGVQVDDKLIFQNDFNQVLAYQIVGPYGGLGGNWYPGYNNYYLGVRFIDAESCTHYGWIRLDVKPGVDTLIIKDYAYETKCDVGILAGDTTGDTTAVVIMENTLSNVNVYSFKNEVFVNIGALQQNTEIVITDLKGSIIYNNILINNTNTITLNDNLIGYYIVKITYENKQFTKVLFIN